MDNRALYQLSYGLFVLTAQAEGKDNGCIINTVIQAAAVPEQLSICVSKENVTHDMIAETKRFTVSVLTQDAQMGLIRHFGYQSGKDVDKFAGYSACKRGKNGVLYITESTNAYISVKVSKVEDLGSHTMFIGEITDMEMLGEGVSLTYEYYFKHIKPKPQETEPTKDGKSVWRCKICGYEYVGDELPEDFICPLCKHPASDFEKIK